LGNKTISLTINGSETVEKIDYINITEATGNSVIVSTKSISVYPNPVKEMLNINIPETGALVTVEIVSVTGEIVWQQKGHSVTKIEKETNSLPTGVYMVRVISGKNTWSSRFVKM
jgi:hypothetical protein